MEACWENIRCEVWHRLEWTDEHSETTTGYLGFEKKDSLRFYSNTQMSQAFDLFFIGGGGQGGAKNPGPRSVPPLLNPGKRTLELTYCWLVVWLPFFIFPLILGMSSSQLPNSYFSEGWPNHQPDWIFGSQATDLARSVGVFDFAWPSWEHHRLDLCGSNRKNGGGRGATGATFQHNHRQHRFFFQQKLKSDFQGTWSFSVPNTELIGNHGCLKIYGESPFYPLVNLSVVRWQP